MHEEGVDDFSSKTMQLEFQKFFAKKQAYMYSYYNSVLDLPNDPFLASLSAECKKKFHEEMMKIWKENGAKYTKKNDAWYMILEGETTRGESQVKLIQDYELFKQTRDAAYLKGTGYSRKGCWFHDLQDAQTYIQMSRDEEGVHWRWPKEIPVCWKKGWKEGTIWEYYGSTSADTDDYPEEEA